MGKFCVRCNDFKGVRTLTNQETFVVRGEPITIEASFLVCEECGEIMYSELDESNLKKAYKKYCEKFDYVDPDTLREMRQTYGLSQRGLASLLNWSPATIARYESGSIPSNAHNEQLKRLKNHDYAYELWDVGKEKLSSLELRRTKEVFQRLRVENRELDSDSLLKLIDNLHSTKHNHLNGNREFDIDRLSNMIIYFTSFFGSMAKSKLLKLLWYADFLSFRETGLSISGAIYCHNHYGPTPLRHELILSYLEELGIAELQPVFYGSCEGDEVRALEQFDDAIFSDDEKEVLHRVGKQLAEFTATKVSALSHEEVAYKETMHNQPISYSFADFLKNV